MTTVDITLLYEKAFSKPQPAGNITRNEYNDILELAKRKQKKPNPKKENPHYLTNRDLYNEVIDCKEKNVMSDKLTRMLQLMCKRYTSKGGLYGYSYNEDMQAFAMLNLVKKWEKFNPDRSTNAFSYFTECIKNSVKYYLKMEKNERDKRDALMVDRGLNPSHSYQIEQQGNVDSDYHGDFDSGDY